MSTRQTNDDGTERPCDGCKERDHCEAPCAWLERMLPSADAGRLPPLTSDRLAEIDEILRESQFFALRPRAFVALYYRLGWRMEDIAAAFDVNKSTVSRWLTRIGASPRKGN